MPRLGATAAATALLALGACAGDDPEEPPAAEPAVENGSEAGVEPATTPEAAVAPPELSADELAALVDAGEVLFLDVRPPEEISEIGTVAGYVSIPIDELADRLDELPRERPIVAL